MNKKAELFDAFVRAMEEEKPKAPPVRPKDGSAMAELAVGRTQKAAAEPEDVFLVEEMEDEFQTVLFRSRLEIKDAIFLPMVVILDNSLYSVLRVWVAARVLSEANQAALEEYMNLMNRRYKIFKYYKNEEGDIVLDVCLIASEENFDPEMVAMLIDMTLHHLQETHDDLNAAVQGEMPAE